MNHDTNRRSDQDPQGPETGKTQAHAKESFPESAGASTEDQKQTDEPIIVADIVEPWAGIPTAIEVTQLFPKPGDLPPSFQNLAALGGAVGAIILGIWSIGGALLTPYSCINALLGMMMGIWGLNSSRRKMAILGMILCLIGLVLSLSEFSTTLANFLIRSEDS